MSLPRSYPADNAECARRSGGRIRTVRLEAGLSPAALAEKVGVPRETVADLEAGKIELRGDLSEQVGVALGRRLRNFAEQ